jgi:spore coat protein A
LIEWCNRLPSQHILPVDHHIHGAEADKPAVRTITHVHGMKVLPQYDGYPEEWFVAGKSKLCEYPNAQNGALYWYHDHALGITRLNVYAGLVGLYLIRDEREQPLNLPAGAYEIPLLIMDRTLDRHGQLDYPVSGDAKAPWVPESFGNIVLVNGKAFPFLEVEPRPYRLRLLNASNARFYQFSFSNAASFQLIGTDQGLVRKPVSLSSLWLAPAERADIIVDFRPYAGQRIVLNNDAPAPAPDGDDYIPSQIMQFRVGKRFTASTAIAALPATLADVPQLQEASASKTRTMTLIEHEGPDGEPTSVLLNDMHWDMPVTEDPVLNTTEIWNLVNLTDDTHPIHLHLVKFQVLDRFVFDEEQFEQDGTLVSKSAAQAPGADEVGWKDTVRVPPRMVTRIIIPFEGYTGRYVWHCHILEHEDNDMMRPFVVRPA